MDEEARAHRRRELDERKKKLEKMRAQKATRSKTAEVSIKAEQAAKEVADKALLQTILSEAKETPKAAPAPPPLPPPPPAVTSSSNDSGSSTDVKPVSSSAELSASAGSSGATAVLQSSVGLAELFLPPVPKETYDQATNTDGPMLNDNEDVGTGEPLSPNGKGELSPTRLSSPRNASRMTPARVDGGNGAPLLSPGAFEVEGELSQGTNSTDGVSRMARLSGEAAAAVLEDTSFRSFVEKKSLVVERALGEALLFDATDDRFLHPTLSAAQALTLEAAAATSNGSGDKSAGAAIVADTVSSNSLEGAGLRGSAASGVSSNSSAGASLREVACLDGAAHSGDLHSGGPGAGGGGGNGRRRPVVALEWSPHRSDVLAISLGAPAAAASSEDMFSHDASFRPTVGTLGGSHSTDVAGVVQLWSLSLLGRPERVLAAHSPILCLCFVPSNPHLICGGTYAGQVVVWDLRRPSALPARRSELGFGHSHPIYALALRNDQHSAVAASTTNANSGHSHRGGGTATEEYLVTASTDGLICEWSLDQLLKPSSSSILRFSSSSSSSSSSKSFHSGNSAVPAAITALNLVRGAVASTAKNSSGSNSTAESRSHPAYALVGAESGELCLTPLLSAHETAMAAAAVGGSAAPTTATGAPSNGQMPWQRVRAHYGMVTSVKAHPQGRALALSAGADWSIRLWSMSVLEKAHLSPTAPPVSDARKDKKNAAASTSSSFDLMSGFNAENSGFDQGTATGALLCDFRGSYDQVADVAWSPKHPALFASASAAGHVTLWDLSRSTSEPAVPLFPVRSNRSSSSDAAGGVSDGSAATSGSSSGSGLESLSKIGWSLDGRRLAVADMEGRVTVLNVSNALADPPLDAVADLDKALGALAADAE